MFVLRVAGQNTELLGIDRRTELEATRAAAAVGVGPEVVDFVEPEGWLVTRFVEGEIPPLERMREPGTLQRVARALRAVHSGPPVHGRFNSFRIVEDYRTTAFDRGADVPPTYALGTAARPRASSSCAALRPSARVTTTSSTRTSSTTAGGSGIVDWEYAGMGDVFFDLANFAINHELDADGRAALLEAYFGSVRPEQQRALELMRFMSDFREAMWGVVQTAVSTLDFDFPGYATEHFERHAAHGATSRSSRPRSASENDEGAPGAPLAASSDRLCRLRRQRELAEPLLLEPLELLLRAHAHRALEPLVRGQDVPPAEQRSALRRRGWRVVQRLPAEVVLPRHARPCTAGMRKTRQMNATQMIAIRSIHL